MMKFVKNKYFVLTLLIVGVALFLFTQVGESARYISPAGIPQQVKAPIQQTTTNAQLGPSVTISGVSIPVEVVRTLKDINKGLSGKSSLGSENGMLFIFSKPAKYKFWMPDMHFDIDIVWINNGKVVDIDANVSKEFDPEHPIFYSPKVPAQYVLEVNAGFAARSGITIGKSVTFNSVK